MRWLVFGVWTLSSCIDSSSIPCSDGQTCPSGTVCATVSVATVPTTFCVDASRVGCTSGEACGNASTCHDRVCFPDDCGNHLVDLSERCDDGNTGGADGCAADCSSDETCGNQTIDPITGESCDIGIIGLSNDGCSSTCRLEALEWRDVSPVPIAAHFSHSMAFDPVRQQMILFGGSNKSQYLDETWAWTGDRWKPLIAGRSPSPRFGTPAVTDTQRKRIVLFGGANDSFLDDTWEWDGITWIDRNPAVHPPARYDHAMAYDQQRQQTVLFGGYNGTDLFTDTWTWDGTTWTKRSPAMSPPSSSARFGNMTYDSIRGLVVYYNDYTTWLWNGTTWSVANVASPGGLCKFFDVMTFDVSRGRVVARCAVDPATTLEWNGVQTSWQPTSGTELGGHIGSSLAYDPVSASALLFGGTDLSDVLSDTWTYNGTWAQPPIVTQAPERRGGHAMTYRATTGETVIFGGFGYGANYLLGDTWLLSGGGWTPFEPDAVPPDAPDPRYDHILDYDSVRDRVVLFSGAISSSQLLQDVWEWDGASWTDKTPASSPPARQYASSAFDDRRKELIVFGGFNPMLLGDTWAWNGSAWSLKSTPVAPSPRTGASMAFDVVRGRVVLYGGAVRSDAPLGDTWEWDGTSWTQLAPATSPGPRWRAPMTYDPDRQRVVLSYGKAQAGLSDEVWEFDGMNWTQRIPEHTSGGRTTLVYSAVEHRFVTFSGAASGGATDDTWALEARPASDPVEACILGDVDDDGDSLLGCADPDCWPQCTPLCPPGLASCPIGPRCGDGACSVLENKSLCPADCP